MHAIQSDNAGMELKTISFAEVANHPAFAALCDEYLAESGNADIGGHCVNTDYYSLLESIGQFFVIGAFKNADLVGFAFLVLNEHPHYSQMIGICDAIFVDKKHRKGAAGLRLIRAVQSLAKEKGVKGVYFSAPEGSRLSMLYAHIFKPTDRVYWAKSKE